eukprot:m.43522 g.43522  ORF g.43522 m.43522 type:complete len:94 (+) comp10780_c0_seq2:70-351(+)
MLNLQTLLEYEPQHSSDFYKEAIEWLQDFEQDGGHCSVLITALLQWDHVVNLERDLARTIASNAIFRQMGIGGCYAVVHYFTQSESETTLHLE